MACQAGKDVYVEKPLSQNIWEGRKTIEAARKYKRVVQVGTQSTSAPYFKKAVEHLRSGKLGDVLIVRCFHMLQSLVGYLNNPEVPVPEGLDYDMWLGPAPKVPYRQGRWYITREERLAEIMVNGRKCTQAPLSDGDTVTVGAYEIHVAF